MAILLESTVNSLNFGRGGGSIASNTRFGCGALSCNSVGTKNTAVGYKTLFSSDKNGNTAAGHCSAAVGNSSGCVTAIGYMAGRCTNGISVSIGSLAGSTTTSERFVAVGYKAGCGISLAAGTVVVGRDPKRFQSGTLQEEATQEPTQSLLGERLVREHIETAIIRSPLGFWPTFIVVVRMGGTIV